MSILIKGMEMPKDGCHHMICIYANGTVSTGGGIYTAIYVPPHGRLIDADAYEELIHGLGNREYRRENGTICDAIKFLHPHYAPTIIPAEKDKT